MPSGFRHAAHACLALLVLVAPARSEIPAHAVTLHEALQLAEARSPRLASFAPARDRALAAAELDALAPAMSLDVQLENFAGTGNASGIDALETTLQLSRVVELGGKADLRRAIGTSGVEQLDARQRAERLDVLADVARRFIHVFADQERLAAARRSVRLAESTVSAVQRRVQAGAASPAALSRAEIALARATIDREHAEHELESSRVMLAAAWGDTVAGFTAAAGNFYASPEPEPLEVYLARIEQSAEALQLASEERVLDARQRLAVAMRRPNASVSLGVRRLEALDGQALVAGFSLPLGSARRGGLEQRALDAERAGLAQTRTTRLLELRATVFGLYQEALHARTEARVLADSVRPQALRMLEIIEAGYRSGRFSLIELADAQRQLLEIEQEQIRAAADFHTQLIEIERLTGERIAAAAEGRSP